MSLLSVFDTFRISETGWLLYQLWRNLGLRFRLMLSLRTSPQTGVAISCYFRLLPGLLLTFLGDALGAGFFAAGFAAALGAGLPLAGALGGGAV